MIQIQKELNDLKDLLSHEKTIYLEILGRDGNYVLFDSNYPTKDLQILADNPYQLNLITKISDDACRVTHISDQAQFKVDYAYGYRQTHIKDKDHSILIVSNTE